MPHPLAKTFLQAAELICDDLVRQGNCLRFAAGEEILFAGDIHGHRKNLAKIIRYANLGAHPNRRLILQEIVHGGPTDEVGGDRSVEALLRAAKLKISYPQQVFFLMGNHDVAELTRSEITKNGRGLCKAFLAGLKRMLADDAEAVRDAVCRMLRSQPLAARCPNGVFLSHSLPSPGSMDLIDWEIFDREYREEDFRRGGTAYEWTWGRGHTCEQLAELRSRLGVRQFLLGHQHIETGYEVHHGCAVVLASNHAHGAIAVFDAGEEMADEDLPGHIKPVVAL